MLGILVAIPVSLVGLAWAKYIGRKLKYKELDIETDVKEPEILPRTSLAFAPIDSYNSYCSKIYSRISYSSFWGELIHRFY